MMQDVLTVMWKEVRGLSHVRGGRSRFLMTMISPILLAVVLPLQAGRAWAEELMPSLLVSFAIPIILVGITIPDSFAGERERHTLGTLLASRLPDRAILFGKMLTAVLFSFSVSLSVLLVGLVVLNVGQWTGRLVLYTPTVALVNVALALLMSTLCAGTGVLVSMRSHTAQEAAQRLMAIFLVPPLILQVAAMAMLDRVRDVLQRIDGVQILTTLLVALAAVDVLVFVLAVARFQRSRLSLD